MIWPMLRVCLVLFSGVRHSIKVHVSPMTLQAGLEIPQYGPHDLDVFYLSWMVTLLNPSRVVFRRVACVN